MSEERKIKPAVYTPTDTAETLSVDIFKKLVDHNRVKLDIKERDKFPNIDGYMELVDRNSAPIGKLEVQVKKLPDNSLKIQCPTSLFAYSEYATCNPVIFVGVDVKNEKAFGVHISGKFLKDPIEKITQKSLLINFPTSNIIDGIDAKYIQEWKSIADSYLNLKQVNEAYTKLLEKTNSLVGLERKEFAEIQVFLDYLNSYLDGRYSIVKKTFYRTAWKLGLAYFLYEENRLGYSLYPIPFGRNDVLIKEVDAKFKRGIAKEGLTTTGYTTENPIRKRPEQLAMEEVERRIETILKNKLLNLRGCKFVAREFIFAFIDKFRIQMGLSEKDEYSIDEIGKAFFQYLPTWTFEAIKFMIAVKRNNITSFAQALYRERFFDPDMFIMQIFDEERKEIHRRTLETIEKTVPVPILPIGNRKLPFRIFYELFSFLKQEGTDKILRPYIHKDFSRLEKAGNWVWNVFSPETIEKNLRISIVQC